ncbi:hypothetical protein A8C56_17580 [Niabella ginsenosidivorans]|uniref:Uncharacterized protein n=1 Tax=Niabella ginsenosidivorans TaxID=1176587 RepID=A0A1A9I7P2_9BACT|nr:hypothetical protein [Niabella ginsenosidivorans]ANH82544.1 hypothetical protein A8C56_17580 [Niabella ginsenosidivorans]
MPYVFSGHGAVMLASLPNSERTIEVDARIVKLFNAMREVLHTNQELLLTPKKIDKNLQAQGFSLKQYDEEIAALFELISQLRKENEIPRPHQPVGFKTKITGK